MKTSRALSLFPALAAAAALLTASPAEAGRLHEGTGENASIISSGGFNNGGGLYKEDGKSYFINKIEGRGVRPKIVGNLKYRGSKSIRTFVARGGSDKKSRSELYLVNPGQWSSGQTRFIGLAFYVPKWVELSPGKWNVFLQVQQGPVTPSLALEAHHDKNDGNKFKLKFMRRWGSGNNDGSNGYAPNSNIGSFEKGRWHRLLIKAKLRHSGGGEAKLYHLQGSNWKLLSSYSGKLGNRWSSDKAKNNSIDVKYGAYVAGGQGDDIEFYHDNVRFSTDFKGAKP